jgi:glycosyltransferase involved in cell wall biosynthesis
MPGRGTPSDIFARWHICASFNDDFRELGTPDGEILSPAICAEQAYQAAVNVSDKAREKLIEAILLDFNIAKSINKAKTDKSGVAPEVLHTVWPSFPSPRQQIFLDVLHHSNRLIVFSEVAANLLRVNYGIATEKIEVIPHGVPDVPFRLLGKMELSDVPPRRVRFITTGLLRSAKGIEHVIAAMGEVKKRFSDFAYVICGADHPRNAGAREYRSKLLAAVTHHGLENHVFFVDRFLEWPELVKAIQACDVGILAYTSPEQSSSGVLALTLSCGRPAIATDFQYARAILDGHNGIVVPAGNLNALVAAIELLALNDAQRARMAEISYKSTRSWVWSEVAQRHLNILKEIGEIDCASNDPVNPHRLDAARVV